MDVGRKFTYAFCSLLFLLLSSCEKSPPLNESLDNRKTTRACENNIIENEFVIRWADGKVTTHKNISRDRFIQKYLNNKNEGKIIAAEPSYRIQLEKATFRPAGQCNRINWGRERINVDQFWQKNITGKNIIVAVTDTGLDLSHPSFAQNIAYNQGEMGLDDNGEDKNSNGIDDDQNGYVDDFAGYDFIYNRNIPTDSVGHGTSVAGVIAASHTIVTEDDNSIEVDADVKGIAPGAKILPLKFIDEISGGTADAIEAIRYAINQGAQIINASWGGNDCSDILPNYMRSMSERNVIFVVASGNENIDLDNLGFNLPIYPASLNLANQITVGAIGSFGQRAIFSNYGENSVELFAPGSGILTVRPGNQITCADGTSFSAPMVSGALALLMEAYPQLNAFEIKELLLSAVEKDVDYLNLTQGSLQLSELLPE